MALAFWRIANPPLGFNALRSSFCVTHARHPNSLTRQNFPRFASNQTEKRAPLKNNKIPFHTVQLADSETGKLGPPTALKEIIDSVDEKEFYVELVSSEPSPIVKIISKKEAFEKKRAQKAKAKGARQMQMKEIQITWGVAEGDWAHKLKKVREELEKGNRVDLVYAPRKGQPLPTPAQMQSRVHETIDTLADCSKEWKPRDLKKTAVVLFLQGTPQPSSS